MDNRACLGIKDDATAAGRHRRVERALEREDRLGRRLPCPGGAAQLAAPTLSHRDHRGRGPDRRLVLVVSIVGWRERLARQCPSHLALGPLWVGTTILAEGKGGGDREAPIGRRGWVRARREG